MRLIDADALLKSAGIFEAKMGARGCGKSILHLAKAWLFNEVNKAQTVDAVPVTRCEKCTHNNERLALTDGGVWCEYWGTDPDGDGFCYKGEGRDDDA